jgi:hypothetical protein
MTEIAEIAHTCANYDYAFWYALGAGAFVGLVLGLFVGASDGRWECPSPTKTT